MQIFIKNMVCDRCVMAVEQVLRKNNLTPLKVALGVVEVDNQDFAKVKASLESDLRDLGFELLDDENTKTIEKIKNLIRELIHEKNNELKVKLSDYLSEKLLKDYSALSHLFSQHEGTTIEKYYVLQKLERVKELLIYNELTLNEIADRLHYSSPAYLNNQFKKVVGVTPGQFKKQRSQQRSGLDQI